MKTFGNTEKDVWVNKGVIMKLVLEQVKPEDVMVGEDYLLMREHKASDGYAPYREWVTAIAAHDMWAFDSGPYKDRKWPTMVFQCPRKGQLVGD